MSNIDNRQIETGESFRVRAILFLIFRPFFLFLLIEFLFDRLAVIGKGFEF
jgi:hypothetical protein